MLTPNLSVFVCPVQESKVKFSIIGEYGPVIFPVFFRGHIGPYSPNLRAIWLFKLGQYGPELYCPKKLKI